MKKTFAFLLTVLLLCSLIPAVWAEGPGISVMKLNPYGGEENAPDTVVWCDVSGRYFFFLPADTDPAAAKVWFSASGEVLLDGVPLVSGGSAAALTEGPHVVSCGDHSYRLSVVRSANLPAVFITTESGSLEKIHKSKENKEPGGIRVYENGEMTLDTDLKQIKGRGNSTFYYPKKPYNIKFDKKTDLFGMGKAKKWTLLANYFDYSLIHNDYGWEFARALGLPYTSEYRHVDLYINGGYLGNYVICESVEVGENRVEINDLDKENEKANPELDIEALPRGGTGEGNTVQSYTVKGSRKWIEIPGAPEDITGGYLLEFDYGSRYDQELCGFVTKNGQPVVIKSPEYASRAQVEYIADLTDAGFGALYSATGYDSAGKHYSAYFDVESLVNMYILQELSMNFDAACSSFFLCKAQGEEKLTFAPVWDMDNAFGSRSANHNVKLTSHELWWANQMGQNGIPTMLSAANRHAAFRAAVRSRWAELKAAGAFEAVNSTVASVMETIAPSAAMNGLRWIHFSSWDIAVNETRWRSSAAVSTGFVADRTAALDRGFGQNGAYLYYDINGAASDGWATVSAISELGDTVAVRDFTGNGTIDPPEGKAFDCWNTAADGSGTRYRPGDPLTLSAEETVLYAVWKPRSVGDADGDGSVAASDARLALRISVGLEACAKGSSAFLACDADGSGSVTAADARLILRRAVGFTDPEFRV